MSHLSVRLTHTRVFNSASSFLQVIIVTTSPSSNFVPNILSKSHNYAAMSKLVSSGAFSAANQKQTMVISASAAPGPSPVAVTTVVSSTPSVVMSTIAQGERVCV